MMTTIGLIIQQASGRSPYPDGWFFHPPSIFTLFDILLTVAAIIFFVRALMRFNARISAQTMIDEETGEPVTPQQYRRLVGRMDEFERDQVTRERALEQRLDAFEFANAERERAMSAHIDALVASIDAAALRASEREARESDFRRETLISNEALLASSKNTTSLVQKALARMNYVADVLDKRPCIINETNNGDEDCPGGEEIGPKGLTLKK